jgi:hypothetical protein
MLSKSTTSPLTITNLRRTQAVEAAVEEEVAGVVVKVGVIVAVVVIVGVATGVVGIVAAVVVIVGVATEVVGIVAAVAVARATRFGPPPAARARGSPRGSFLAPPTSTPPHNFLTRNIHSSGRTGY